MVGDQRMDVKRRKENMTAGRNVTSATDWRKTATAVLLALELSKTYTGYGDTTTLKKTEISINVFDASEL